MLQTNNPYWRAVIDRPYSGGYAEAYEEFDTPKIALPSLAAATQDFSLQKIADGTLGVLPKEFTEAILVSGETDALNLTDRVFYHVNHPEMAGRKINPITQKALADEWRNVLNTQVAPLIWLRQVIDRLDEKRGSVPRELLLGWMAVKSDGNVRLIGRGGERGYFQIDWPTASALGLDRAGFGRLSTQRRTSIDFGVQLVASGQITGDLTRAQALGAKLKPLADLVPSSSSTQPEFEEENGGRGDAAQVAKTFDVPWRWICKVSIRKDGKYVKGGTGVLISDRHVLTAAHVVYDVYQNRAQFDLEVNVAQSGTDDLGGIFASTSKPLIPAGYKPDQLESDYALITLDTAVGARTFSELGKTKLCYWGSSDCGAGTLFVPVAAGFLVGKTGYTAGYPKARGGHTMWRFSGLLHSAETAHNIIWFTAEATEGQSGSPVWIKQANNLCLAGVLVAEGRSSSAVVPLTTSVVSQLQTWMEKTHELFEFEEGLEYDTPDEIKYTNIVKEVRKELALPFVDPDDPKLFARRQRLKTLFSSVPKTFTKILYERLGVRAGADELSKQFHRTLATATRMELLDILKRNFPPPPAPPAPATPPPPAPVWPTSPLPPSQKGTFLSILAKLESKVRASSDPRKWRYLCWIEKLKHDDVDDRVIRWAAICPATTGALGAAWVVGPCDLTAGSPVKQADIQSTIKSIADVETSGQTLGIVTFLKSDIVLNDMTAFPLENLQTTHDQVQFAIDNLDKWANSAIGGSSAMPKAYVSIKDWIGQQQGNSKSLYSCM
jgi:V8-like Glu-specific endopeptidase